MKRACYLYHICRKSDKYNFSVGYIGVSFRPRKRWASGGYKDNPHLQNAFKKYDDIIHYVILCGSEQGCLRREAILRPTKNIGWNIAAGGGKPPSPKGTSRCVGKLPKEKRRTDYTCSEETREKLRIASSKRVDEYRHRMLTKNPSKGKHGKDRATWSGWFVTPSGKFETRAEAAAIHGVSTETISRRCVKGGIIGRSRFVPIEWVGKTWSDLGWYFEKCDDKDALPC